MEDEAAAQAPGRERRPRAGRRRRAKARRAVRLSGTIYETSTHRYSTSPRLLPGLRRALALDDLDVGARWEVGKLIDPAARPADLQAVYFRRAPEAEDLARVVRGEVAAAGSLQAAAPHPARLPGDDGPGRAGRALGRDQLE